MVSETSLIEMFIKRMNTNICLDVDSEFYGCGDRNHWHYKIRDFPSIILQQGIEASVRNNLLDSNSNYMSLGKAALIFWARRASHHNSFEEYYPYENGYPPLAFSTLSICRLINLLEIDIDEVFGLREALNTASKQLSNRIEDEAVNQYAAGVAALALLSKLQVSTVDTKTLDRHIIRLLSLQRSEGWFPEYGGFDLGYLSVTIDCLWDLYDVQPDTRILNAIKNAGNFIAKVTSIDRISFGKLNSRNTDYIVPYGLLRLSQIDDCLMLRALVQRIYENLILYSSLDDRYLMHYIGISFIRARGIQCQKLYLSSLPTLDTGKLTSFPDAGLVRCVYRGEDAWLNIKKGVVCSTHYSDWGLRIYQGSKCYETGVVPYNIDAQGEIGSFKVYLTQKKEFIPSFLKLTVIKIFAYTFGRSLIKALKRRVIHNYDNEITIAFDPTEGFKIVKNCFPNSSDVTIVKAPAQSFKHVASAEWNI